jgi:small-conductance mechanosensitive channel
LGISGEELLLVMMDLLIFAVLFVAILIGLVVVRRTSLAVIQRLNRNTPKGSHRAAHLKHMLDNVSWFTPLAIAGLGALALHSPLSDRLETTVRIVCLTLLFVQAGLWAMGLLNLWLEKGLRAFGVSDQSAASAVGIIRFFAVVAIWSILLLMIMSNMGVQIGPLLAGLGVGGIAIAFALQKILSDVFCSVAIVMDKPFEVGDFIVVDPSNQGAVEKIGIKTTRVRSLTGEEIVFSNQDLLDARLHNFKRMRERRIVFGFGVLYQTPVEVLEQIPGRIQSIFEAEEMARFDRAHLKEFGDSAFIYEVVYYVLDRDARIYLDTQQRVNFAIIRLLKELGTDFAYPTQTLHVDSWPALQQTPGGASMHGEAG